MLILAGGILMPAIAAIFHRWSSRLLEKRRYFAARLWVPILLVGVLIVIPPAFAILYSIPYPGYELQADEAPGRAGSGLGVFILLLWPYWILVVLIYALAGFFRLFRIEKIDHFD